MKLVITQNDGTHDIVVDVADTNLTDPADTRLIEVGGHGVHLVPDTDTHVVGDVYVTV